jgi:uncharacterized membrane protein
MVKSSMRLSLYWIVGMAVAFALSVCANIIVATIKGTEIDWQGIAFMIGAIGLFTGPAFGFKTWQKKYEVKGNTKFHETSK